MCVKSIDVWSIMVSSVLNTAVNPDFLDMYRVPFSPSVSTYCTLYMCFINDRNFGSDIHFELDSFLSLVYLVDHLDHSVFKLFTAIR